MTLSSIQFSADSVSELDGKRKSVSIAKQDIRDICLKYGHTSERPILQVIMSAVLILLGLCLGVYPMHEAIVQNDLPSVQDKYISIANIKLFAFAVPLILIGAYLIQPLIVKRFYLLVQTYNDTRKLVFNDKVDRNEVMSFIENCNRSLGFGVRIEEGALATV